MKVKFDIECTPEEARQFFGLPDVAKLQERAMDGLEQQLRENIKAMDPEAMMKTWLPNAMQSWGDIQRMWQGGAANSESTDTGAGSAADKARTKR